MTAITFQQGTTASLNRHALLGSAAVLALAGGLTYWAAVTPLSGAVIAGGSVVVDGGVQRIQHQEGGIVDNILVRNDMAVSAGDVLVVLDDTMIAANLAVVEAQLGEAYIRRAGLLAESNNSTTLTWPDALDTLPNIERHRELFGAEGRLRLARATAHANQVGQINEQIVQLENQLAGLEAQREAIGNQLEIVSEQSQSLEALLAQRLVEAGKVIDLRGRIAQLEGEKARVLTEIARGRAAIAEKNLQISQSAEAFQAETLARLQEVNRQIAELEQQKIAAGDRLERLVIRAPISGTIHDLQIATLGGVVGPGATLMQIVPRDEEAKIDVRISPLDIDKLKVDQSVTLKMSSFNARETPELTGNVDRISPDIIRDPVNGAQFYVVRVNLSETELARLPDGDRLIPGMPVEAFFATGERTVLNYLAKPALDQITLAFRED
ncbi:MAG: hypothetical protein ABS76_16050 [Pelagibacterium sp. SCN 64-44]|nr:MAG: hypothetical protein ABS76_16050 [Pelagibacterium sp. SCN 64-44]